MRLVLVLALFPAPLLAQQERAAIDLAAFRAPPPAREFPTIVTPIDNREFEGFPWYHSELSFEALARPPYERHALDPGSVAGVVVLFAKAPQLDAADVTDETLYVPAGEEAVADARRILDVVERAANARLVVSAMLLADDGAGGQRLVASGGAALAPRRWTSLWSQLTRREFVTHYVCEVAEESVAYEPMRSELAEGSELVLRLSPGESVSLLEIGLGEVDQLEPTRFDLSTLRAVPESNAMGTVGLPRSGVRRAWTTALLPNGAPSSVEIVWEGAGTRRLLRIELATLPPSPPPMEASGGAVAALARSGAICAPPEGPARTRALEGLTERLYEGNPEIDHFDQLGEFLLVFRGAPDPGERLRALVAEAEGKLESARVELRVLAVPERALREMLLGGQVVVGARLAAERLGALLEAGGTTLARVSVPVVAGVRASARAGAMVAGFLWVEAQLAQRSGGLQARAGARFDGLQAELEWSGRSRNVLRYGGRVHWASPKGSTVEVAFRPPIAMSGAPRTEDPSARRVTIPLLAAGSATLEGEVAFSREDLESGTPRVLAVVVPGSPDGVGEPLLVLATVR